MKNGTTNLRFNLTALGGVLLALSVARVQSADVIINQFNSSSEVGQWRFDFGGVTHTAAFDGTVDSGGNPTSGSMKVILGFNTALGADNKAAYTRDAFFPGTNGANFASLKFDIKVDPSSALDAFGNNGFFALALRNTDNYDFVTQIGYNIRSDQGWIHIDTALTPPDNAIRALTWQLYGGPQQNINGTVTLWVDNVAFTPVPEPSTLALAALGVLGLLTLRWRR